MPMLSAPLPLDDMSGQKLRGRWILWFGGGEIEKDEKGGRDIGEEGKERCQTKPLAEVKVGISMVAW